MNSILRNFSDVLSNWEASNSFLTTVWKNWIISNTLLYITSFAFVHF